MRRDVKERLLGNQRKAEHLVAEMLALGAAETARLRNLEANPSGVFPLAESTPAVFRERFLSYVLAKFGMPGADVATRTMEGLAEESLARALERPREDVDESQHSATCDGARSVDMKQALLIMAINREFAIALDGREAALADEVDDLADLVWLQLVGKRA